MAPNRLAQRISHQAVELRARHFQLARRLDFLLLCGRDDTRGFSARSASTASPLSTRALAWVSIDSAERSARRAVSSASPANDAA